MQTEAKAERLAAKCETDQKSRKSSGNYICHQQVANLRVKTKKNLTWAKKSRRSWWLHSQISKPDVRTLRNDGLEEKRRLVPQRVTIAGSIGTTGRTAFSEGNRGLQEDNQLDLRWSSADCAPVTTKSKSVHRWKRWSNYSAKNRGLSVIPSQPRRKPQPWTIQLHHSKRTAQQSSTKPKSHQYESSIQRSRWVRNQLPELYECNYSSCL